MFGGLPGTGKTTIAREIARLLGATYLRIDVIEQAIRTAGVLAETVGASGYDVAIALAQSNLANGGSVVADCVNPVTESRAAWRALAGKTASPVFEIEVICSDPLEHRRRVETRTSDIPGLVNPDWQSVLDRTYEPWPDPHFVIDTARLDAERCIAAVRHKLVNVIAN